MRLDHDTRKRAVEAFHRAVEILDGQSATARVAGCTPGNIHQLLNKGSVLPAEYVIPVEAASGVSRHDLRPDIYPRECMVDQARAGRFTGVDGRVGQRRAALATVAAE